MRIALTSDLHVDHHPEVIPLVADEVRARTGGRGADLLVIAGDVSPSTEHLEAALRGLRPCARQAVFVPGNHDLWALPGSPSSRARYDQVLPACARAAGFQPLGHVPAELDGVRVVGVTGWFDYTLRNRELDREVGGPFAVEDYRKGVFGRLRWNDKARVHWPGDDGTELDDPAICGAQLALLEAQLQQAAGAPTIVVTHHLPFRELVTSLGEMPWDFLNGFMGSQALGDAILRAPDVALVVCGHTHFRKQATLVGAGGPVRVEVSPIGYPREYRRAGMDLAARVRDRVALVEL